MKQLLLKPPYERIVPFFSLFASLFLLALPPSLDWIEYFFSRYLSFAALFLTWNAAVFFIDRYRLSTAAGSKDTTTRKNVALAAMALAVIASLLLLNFIKIKFELPFFYLTLLLLGQQGLAHLAKQRGRRALAVLCLWIYDTGLAYLSFQMALFHWSWQPLAVAISFSTLLAAVRIAAVLETDVLPVSTEARRTRWIRAYSAAIPIGLTGVVLLALLGQLPQIYVAPYLLLPFMPRLLARARAEGGAPGLGRQTAGLTVLFTMVVLICAAMVRSQRPV